MALAITAEQEQLVDAVSRFATRHAPIDKTGPVLELCKTVTAVVCAPQYTSNKGERRIVHTGVRNDGSSPEASSCSMRRSPRSRRSPMATAAAWLSAITGEGCRRSSSE